MSQGYITLAVGERKYFQMAENLAMSVRHFDPSRPISLVCDREDQVGSRSLELFDRIIRLPQNNQMRGPANKLQLYKLSPYDETMFLDGDCLLLKSDMDRHWAKYGQHDIGIAGRKASTGSWYNFRIEDVLPSLGANYIVTMNSGMFFFRSGELSNRFFQFIEELYFNPANTIAADHRGLGIADEPYLGAAMGCFGLEPVSYTAQEGTSMITSYQSRRWRVDIRSEYCSVEKSKGFLLFNRWISKGWVKHSPTVGHFIKLKPARLYKRLTREFEELTFGK